MRKNGVTARFGIDVSEFQGEEIDWKQVKDSGVEFVIIRLGYRAYGDSGELVLMPCMNRISRGRWKPGLTSEFIFSPRLSMRLKP